MALWVQFRKPDSRLQWCLLSKRKIRREKSRRERVRKKEDADAQKGGKSRNTMFFQ